MDTNPFPFEELLPELRGMIQTNHLNTLDLWLLSMTSTAHQHLRPEYHVKLPSLLLATAIYEGYMAIFNVLIRRRETRLSYPMMITAIKGGHLSMVQRLADLIFLPTYAVHETELLIGVSVEEGNLEAFVYLWEKYSPNLYPLQMQNCLTPKNRIYGRIGEKNLIGFLEYLKEKNPVALLPAAIGAASRGCIPALLWIKENSQEGTKILETALMKAAECGHLPVLKFFLERDCNPVPSLFNSAARSGNVEIMEYLASKGCSLFKGLCGYAASSGNLEALRWLRDLGCPWDKKVIPNASTRGFWDIVSWARDNGCPD